MIRQIFPLDPGELKSTHTYPLPSVPIMPVSESATGLRIGHLSVYHLFKKVLDVSILLILTTHPPLQNQRGHTSIEYMSFKNFNVDRFLSDLSTMPFHSVFNYNIQSKVLAFWYDAFLPVVNKHAPLRRKRVKHPKLPP